MSTDTLTTDGVRRWRLDPARSTAEFRVPNLWGLVKVKGRFERLSGWPELGGEGELRLELTIDANSFNTGNARLKPARDDPDAGNPHGPRGSDTGTLM
jgi:polyisoprenoid-binding protein YceI